jgi:hypothetical protein
MNELFISFLGGLTAKLYDDLNDNTILQKFYNNTFMEFLKGLHFISFTTISIEEPLFFIISYIANILNYLGNNDAFNEPYENSLLYSFILLFTIINYKKITTICILDNLLMISMFLSMLMEPIIMYYFFKNSEFSFQKIIMRSFFLINSTIGFLLCKSKAIKYLFSYCIGYLLFSVIVQYYSLMSVKDVKETGQTNEAKEEGQTKQAKEEGQTNEAKEEGQTNEAKEEGQTNEAKEEGQTNEAKEEDLV